MPKFVSNVVLFLLASERKGDDDDGRTGDITYLFSSVGEWDADQWHV